MIEFDASGLNCPLPILRTKKEIGKMEVGEKIKIVATDPGSVKDMEAFCNQTGNKLISSGEIGDKFEFIIEKV